MKKTTLILLIFFPCLVTACITPRPRSSGVMPFGPDTYKINVSGWTILDAVKQGNEEANNFCNERNKKFMPINSSSIPHSSQQWGNYDLTFRCLKEGDPELHRPDWKNSPDIIIENK